MKRVFFHITLASLLALGIYILLVGFLLRAIVAIMDEIFWRFFFTSVLMTIFYGVSLLYFTKIRGRLEEQQIVKDYENHPYDSIVKDFCLIIRRERAYICCLFVISALCFLLHILSELVYCRLLKARNLRLAYADFLSNFHLCLPLVEAHINNTHLSFR